MSSFMMFSVRPSLCVHLRHSSHAATAGACMLLNFACLSSAALQHAPARPGSYLVTGPLGSVSLDLRCAGGLTPDLSLSNNTSGHKWLMTAGTGKGLRRYGAAPRRRWPAGAAGGQPRLAAGHPAAAVPPSVPVPVPSVSVLCMAVSRAGRDQHLPIMSCSRKSAAAVSPAVPC